MRHSSSCLWVAVLRCSGGTSASSWTWPMLLTPEHLTSACCAVPATSGDSEVVPAAACHSSALEAEVAVLAGAKPVISRTRQPLAVAEEAGASRARRAAQAKELLVLAERRHAPRRRARTISDTEVVAKRLRMVHASEAMVSGGGLVSSSTSAALVSSAGRSGHGTSSDSEFSSGDSSNEGKDRFPRFRPPGASCDVVSPSLQR